MKKYLPLAGTMLAVAAIAFTLRLPRNPETYDVVGFGHLPALVNGRIKPLDTVARTSLLMIQGRQRVSTPEGGMLIPDEWLLDVFYRPERADTYQTFEIVHPDLLSLLNLQTADGAGGKRFSIRQIFPRIAELDRQAKLADSTETAVRAPFQRATVQLRNAVLLYQRLQSSVLAPGSGDFLAQLDQLERALPGMSYDQPASGAHSSDSAKLILEMGTAFATMERFAYLHLIPPEPGYEAAGWRSMGAAWTATLANGRVDPGARMFADLGRAWRDRQPDAFNRVVREQRDQLTRNFPSLMRKSTVETRFNSAQPFYSSAVLYVLGFLVAAVSWLKWPENLGRTGRRWVAVAFVVSTIGIGARMWLEARPPVTNLYSSALFVGWAGVALCLVLERFYHNSIGTVAGGVIGFATLLIAHHLALGGDTMEMMRAVLDSNFWLATHVVTIAIGYSATFLAGFLAMIYVLRGVLTRSLDQATASSLARMIYGVVCFATLFSFVGTILGGIWADQSWGRFWGWDPKENGALLIVIWNAFILHARWGGLVQARGLAMLAIFGNIVTAWSWFGVNMLGVGLHSYGFMDAAFWWLVGFAASQLALIGVAALPVASWRSAGMMMRAGR
jgi:ABC-type transport system involved in cytochrome c biogenesis permease subunit